MKNENNNSGWILVAVALFLVVLCGFVALAIDVGSFYSVRTSAQRAADAGALAGALTFVTSCQSSLVACDAKTIAEDHAKGVALANKIMNTPVQQATATANVAARQVTVTVTQSAPTFFAGVLGFRPVSISATATAEAGHNATVAQCAKPMFVPNTLHVTNPYAVCKSANPHIVVDSAGNVIDKNANDFIGDFSQIKVVGAPEPLTGSAINIFAMDLSSDGGTQYGFNLTKCTNSTQVVCNESYSILNQSSVDTATKAELKKQIDATGDTREGTSKTYIGRYKSPSNTISNTSNQLFTMPIFDVCSIPGFGPTNTLPNPVPKIKVVGFARMFAQTDSSGQVWLYVEGISGCSNYDPTKPNTTGPYGIPVRLVHN
jgi:Flp pilus assembly protein TadG